MEKYGTRSDGKLLRGGGGDKNLARILGAWGECLSNLPGPVALAHSKITMLVPQREIKRRSWDSRAWRKTQSPGMRAQPQ